ASTHSCATLSLHDALPIFDGEGAEVIRSAQAGLVCEAGDSRGLAAAVREMARMSPVDRTAMGTSGRRFAQREFDRTMLMDQLEQDRKSTRLNSSHVKISYA